MPAEKLTTILVAPTTVLSTRARLPRTHRDEKLSSLSHVQTKAILLYTIAPGMGGRALNGSGISQQ